MNSHICKAKIRENNKWIQGYYVYKTDPLLNLPYHYILSQEHQAGFALSSSFLTWYEVDPETVCRYTGFNDKNGNPIFENDIIIIDDGYGPFEACVHWAQACGCVEIIYNNLCDMLCNYEVLEVIGNKFDNTELMED